MSKPLRTGILACGPRANQMAKIIRLYPELYKLEAMSDPDPANIAIAKELFPDVTFFESSEALLETCPLDAVLVETPPEVHAKYTLMALERGIHVLGEIPAVNTYDEAVELWNTVSKYPDLVYMSGATGNYRQKTQALKFLQAHNLVGNMVYAEVEYSHGMERPYDASKYPADNWRRTYDACRYCTHSLGPLLELMEDDAFDTVACMGTGQHFPAGWKDHAMVSIIRTRKNKVIRFLASFALYKAGPYHTSRIYTDGGMFELYSEKIRIFKPETAEFCEKPEIIEIPFGRVPRRLVDDFPFDKVMAAGGGGHGGADFIMLEEFADAILNGKPSPMSVQKGLAMTLPGIFAADSAHEGGALKKIRYPWE